MIAASAEQLRLREPFKAQWKARGWHTGLTLPQEVRLGAARTPGARIIVDTDGGVTQVTAAELQREADTLAAKLAGLGCRTGDVIAIQLPNCVENAVMLLAALRLGMVVVPLVMIYGPAELGFILRQSGARLLVVSARWRNADMAARLRDLPRLPALEHIVVVGDGEMGRPVIRWDELQRRAPVDLPPEPADPDAVCVVNYTSGTTASPKGVMHTHNTLGAEARDYPGLIDVAADEPPSLLVVPAGHIGGMIFILRPFLCGDSFVFMNTWDAVRAVELIDTHESAYIAGVPLYLNALLDLPKLPRSIRIANTGGAGVPPALVERGDKRGLSIVRAYGSTEHPTVSCGRAGDPLAQRAFTDGRVAPGSLVRIAGEDGSELPTGQAGEITSMGPELFVGYLDAALDREAFTADGWYRSGDMGVMDADGFLTVVDRKKDIIIRGGENISSQEVEGIMARHPAVAEAVAVAWPDSVYGERVGVFVRLRPGRTIDIPQIQAHFVAEGVARQKTPERLVLVEDFERTAMGKVVKATLRKRIAAEIEKMHA